MNVIKLSLHDIEVPAKNDIYCLRQEYKNSVSLNDSKQWNGISDFQLSKKKT